jgi:V/A-type H+-transporting ATPase subunit B
LSSELDRKGIYPPINVLPSLSRLMKDGIGEGETRADHQNLSNQLYSAYTAAQNARNLAEIIGESDLPEREKYYLRFGDTFEQEFLKQGMYERRTTTQTLDLGWKILGLLPREELTRVTPGEIGRYYRRQETAVAGSAGAQAMAQADQATGLSGGAAHA